MFTVIRPLTMSSLTRDVLIMLIGWWHSFSAALANSLCVWRWLAWQCLWRRNVPPSVKMTIVAVNRVMGVVPAVVRVDMCRFRLHNVWGKTLCIELFARMISPRCGVRVCMKLGASGASFYLAISILVLVTFDVLWCMLISWMLLVLVLALRGQSRLNSEGPRLRVIMCGAIGAAAGGAVISGTWLIILVEVVFGVVVAKATVGS